MKESGIYEQLGVAMTCRSFDEYAAMFQLTEKELSAGPILDVAAGGSSFAAGATVAGYEAFAIDPRYQGDSSAWIQEAAREIVTSTEKLASIQDRFDWSYYGSLEQHREGREASLLQFQTDLQSNSAQETKRYINGRLPSLPLPDNRYGLVLCSHFLFLYAEQFAYDFHLASIRELLRVCKPGGQVRIYPLLSLRWEPYDRLEELIEAIQGEGKAEAAIQTTGLPFIPGSIHYLNLLKKG
jgi:SAM-dependent methyltransferase